MTRRVIWSGWAVAALVVVACSKPAPPAPTVALAEAARPGVTLERGSESVALSTNRRVEEGSELRTPDAGRATLRLDGGSWALLDSRSRVKVQASKLELLAGRLWVDARDVDTTTVKVAGATLTATAAGFAAEIDGKGGARVYCVQGQLTYVAKTNNRLEAGMSIIIGPGGEIKEEPESQWDDWTGGLAKPGPPRPLEPAGIGALMGRRSDEVGAARVPIIVRHHDVKTVIDHDMAITDVEQTFFNPRSETLEGLYTLRLPPGALLAGFAVAAEGETPGWLSTLREYIPHIVPATNPNETVTNVALEWVGNDRYRARIQNLQPGKVRVVHVRYVEWLERHGNRRTWTYAMGGGNPPLLKEFSLVVDVAAAGTTTLEAGMGAEIKGRQVNLIRSDFRPRADFALDLIDGESAAKTTTAYRVPSQGGEGEEVGKGYLMVNLDPKYADPPSAVDMVLVVDVSAATDPSRLDLEKAVVDAILRQLTTGDKVAVLAASIDARPLGKEPFLAPVTTARSDELIDALARQAPAGATDLATAFEKAAALLPPGQGVVVYIGDGRPSVGPLLPGQLKDRLARLADLPRIFTVGVGADARLDLLSQAMPTEGGGLSVRVEDRPEAAHAAYRVLAAATTPTLRGVSYDLGPNVDVVYPASPLVVASSAPLHLLARLRGAAPEKLVLRGKRNGKAFADEIPLSVQSLDDTGDVRRRWAAGRLADLLARGSGREAIVQIGTRFGLITPYTAMITTDGGNNYTPIEPYHDPGGYVPMALRNRAPDDSPVALEEETSRAVGATDLNPHYQHLLAEHDEGIRVCFDRKAARNAALSGRVELKLKVGLAGEIAAAQQLTSTLNDAEVEACILRAIKAQRLPPPPDAKIHEFVQAYQFEADDGRLGASTRCSTASHQYVASRRALWRERLASHPGPEGAMIVWRGAERSCELKTWLDRRALLDLLRPHSGTTVYQIDLYHRFAHSPDVQGYLRREILRAVRTAEDIRAIRGGLALDGGISGQLIDEQLKKAPDAAARIKVLRLFLALSPDGIALRVKLLGLLEAAGQFDEAARVAWALRGDPAADAATRQAIGEYFARRGDAVESARAFSEIVEFAPFDPWARRRLGDLYRAHGRHEDAYREYATLAWLLPNDGSVLLLLAQAAAGAGRTDEALRLEERLAETVDAKDTGNNVAAWARSWNALRLGGLRDGARRAGDAALVERLAARSRSAGVLTWAGQVVVGLTWPHPDARLELALIAPGDKVPRRAPVQGGAVGIESMRLQYQEKGEYTLTVRRPASSDPIRAFDAELWLLWDEAQPHEKLQKVAIHLEPNVAGQDFTLNGHSLGTGKAIAVVVPKPTKTK